MGLCTAQEVRELLDSVSVEDDAAINLLIRMRSTQMAKAIGQTIEDTTITDERYYPTGTHNAIVLRNGPVLEITSVTEGDDALTSAQYRVEGERSLVRLSSNDRPIVWANTQVVVAYRAGHAEASIPDDLRGACAMQVASDFAQTGAGNLKAMGMDQKSSDQGGTTTFAGFSWLSNVADALASHVSLLS